MIGSNMDLNEGKTQKAKVALDSKSWDKTRNLVLERHLRGSLATNFTE